MITVWNEHVSVSLIIRGNDYISRNEYTIPHVGPVPDIPNIYIYMYVQAFDK